MQPQVGLVIQRPRGFSAQSRAENALWVYIRGFSSLGKPHVVIMKLDQVFQPAKGRWCDRQTSIWEDKRKLASKFANDAVVTSRISFDTPTALIVKSQPITAKSKAGCFQADRMLCFQWPKETRDSKLEVNRNLQVGFRPMNETLTLSFQDTKYRNFAHLTSRESDERFF